MHASLINLFWCGFLRDNQAYQECELRGRSSVRQMSARQTNHGGAEGVPERMCRSHQAKAAFENAAREASILVSPRSDGTSGSVFQRHEPNSSSSQCAADRQDRGEPRPCLGRVLHAR